MLPVISKSEMNDMLHTARTVDASAYRLSNATKQALSGIKQSDDKEYAVILYHLLKNPNTPQESILKIFEYLTDSSKPRNWEILHGALENPTLPADIQAACRRYDYAVTPGEKGASWHSLVKTINDKSLIKSVAYAHRT